MRVALAAALALAIPLAACGSESLPDGPYGTLDSESWKPVSDVLAARCATLDCHGTTARNLRLYSGQGLRLAGDDVPGATPTTDDEYEAGFASVMGLEPELMRLVAGDGGEDPERLTLVRKARGVEEHKGKTLLKAGQPADDCLMGWLASKPDPDACEKGLRYGPQVGWESQP